LESAVGLDSDAIILDLEDSVPLNFKQEARNNIRDYLTRDRFVQQVFVRVNCLESGMLDLDLECAAHYNTDGFVFTKVRDERDIVELDRQLTKIEHERGLEAGHFKMCPLIETASAVIRAYEIARASPRMVGLAFGGEDYLHDVDGLHKDSGLSLLVPRSMIVMAARASGIDAIDTPYLNIHDSVGLRREFELSREIGFSGSLIIHPSQVGIANDVFSPSTAEVSEAIRTIRAIEDSVEKGLGVALLDGKLVGPPMEKRARRILEKASRIDFSQAGGKGLT